MVEIARIGYPDDVIHGYLMDAYRKIERAIELEKQSFPKSGLKSIKNDLEAIIKMKEDLPEIL